MQQSSPNEKGFTAGKKITGKFYRQEKKYGKYFSGLEKNLQNFFLKSSRSIQSSESSGHGIHARFRIAAGSDV